MGITRRIFLNWKKKNKRSNKSIGYSAVKTAHGFPNNCSVVFCTRDNVIIIITSNTVAGLRLLVLSASVIYSNMHKYRRKFTRQRRSYLNVTFYDECSGTRFRKLVGFL